MEQATLAGGCFWCTEALFKRLKGVISVVSGFAGKTEIQGKEPSYEQVSTGTTGHAEAIQITFDPTIIPFEKLLDIFFHVHNPTTLNQQGADRGTQYRSAIFYHNTEQKEIAEKSKKELEKEKVYDQPIVTAIEPFVAFYPAESYHQNYYDSNKSKPYCSVVIDPKIKKLLLTYSSEVMEDYKK